MYSTIVSSGMVVLIDTPGFNDSDRSDSETLRDLSYFLAQVYHSDRRLSGIIYLHRIKDRRMYGSSMKDFAILKKLVGRTAFSHIVLTTTFWAKISPENGQVLERALVESSVMWGALVEEGASVARFDGTRLSGLNIIQSLANKSSVVLDIQRELAIDKKPISETAAWRCLQLEKERSRGMLEAERKKSL